MRKFLLIGAAAALLCGNYSCEANEKNSYQASAPNAQDQKQEQWLEAIQKGNLHDVIDTLKKGANPNQATARKSTPLLIAVIYGDKDIVRCLVEHGADINKANNDGVTPLQVAKKLCKKSHSEKKKIYQSIITYLKSKSAR